MSKYLNQGNEFSRMYGINESIEALAREDVLEADIYESLILFVFFYLMVAYLGYDAVYNEINDDKVYEILVKTDK